MKILNDIVDKVLSTPEAAAYLRKAFINRDLAIEIDGKRYQLTRRRPDETEKNVKELKEQRVNVRRALKNLIMACEESSVDLDQWIIDEAAEARKVLGDN